MKLRTSLQVSAVFPVALAIIVTLSIFIRSRSLSDSRRALEIAQTALPLVSEVNASLYSYMGQRDEEARSRWLVSIQKLNSYCSQNSELEGVLGFLVSEVAESAGRIERLAASEAGRESVMEQAGKEMSRMFAAGYRLLSVSRQQAEAKEQASETAFLVFIAVFAMLMTGSVFSASSRVIKRLKGIRSVCDSVRSGEVNQRIDIGSDDEISDFGRSFNALVKQYETELTKLRAEVGTHRKGEEARDTASAAAREGNIRLADALTKLKRAQNQIVQQERVRALEQVVTGVARDFNDMLAPVLTMSDFLLADPTKLKGRDDLREDIRVINGSARKTFKQVRTLTDLFESFETPYPQKLRIADIVSGAEGLIEKESRLVLTDFNIEKDFADVPFVAGNEVDYMEAIRNLLENAMEAMDEGGKLLLRTRQEGSSVILTIRDDGVGMSDEIYSKALEPFFSTKGRGHSGMGLTFVVVAVGKYGGSVNLTSAAEQGTTVEVSLPVFDPKIHKGEPEESKSQDLDKLKVLIVDDEEWTRVVLARSLSSEGHDVTTAAGGQEGWNEFESGDFDIVILDRAMPDVTGDELAGRILDSRRGTPVIMLTGFGDLMIKKGETVRGVDIVASKPVTLKDLKSAISRGLSSKKS